MRIMFVATAHNSLSQRLQVELINRGHGVAIHLATGADVMTNAVQEHQPDLIVAPMLKRAIPREIEPPHLPHRAPGHQRRSRSLVARLGDRSG